MPATEVSSGVDPAGLPPDKGSTPRIGSSHADEPDDPFNPAKLRLSQDYVASGGVRRHLTAIPVRKPSKEEWVRVRTGAGYTVDTVLLELKDTREIYLVSPTLREELFGEPTLSIRRLHMCVNRQGGCFLWPLRLPASDGRADRWTESALEIAEAAQSEWVRVRAEMGLGSYVYDTPIARLPDPVWPSLSLAEMLRLAFKTSFIDSDQHPVLQRLRGEV